MKRLGVIILLLVFALGISAQENKDPLRGVADSLSNVASSAYKKGDYHEALDAQKQVVDIYEKTGNTNNQTYVLVLNDLARYYSRIGSYKKAIEIETHTLKISESIIGKQHSDYALSLSILANNYAALGNYQKAIELGIQAMRIREVVLGKNHRDYATSLNNLAIYYSDLGNYQKAIELGTQALHIRELVLGKNSSDYAASLNNLTSYYSDLGNYQKAIELGTQALHVRESVLGKNHPEYAQSLSNLANYYSDLGNYQKAVELGTQALHIRESVFGRKSSDYATSLNNLMIYYSDWGNYQKAIGLGTQALHIRESVFGKNHPDYAQSLGNLASCYSDLGNYQKAIDLGLQALQIRESVLGKNHLSCAKSLNNLANYYSASGNYQKATELGIHALNIIEIVIGKNNLSYAITLDNLANYYSALANYQKAIELGSQALNIQESVLGSNHPDYAVSLNNLAGYYSALGNYQKAIELGTHALNIQNSISGKNPSDYASLLNNLAGYYSDLGNYQKAIELGLQTLNIRESVLSKNHPDYAASLNDLAIYYFALGNYQKAIELGTKALHIRKSVFGKVHPDYAGSLNNLAIYYSALGNFQKAIDLETQALNIKASVWGKNHPDYALSLNNLADYYLESKNYNLTLTYLMPFDEMTRDLIRSNFQTMTSSERYYFWNKYSNIYTNYLPSVDYKIRSEKTEGLCYNSQLLSKGLLLTMGTEMKRLIQESGDTSVITKYEALQQLRSTLRKVYELPISKRSMNTDSLETVAQQIEKEIVKGSKQYGDFTRNMLLEWQDVQKELKNEDTAIEFVDFPINKDSTEYAAMVLRKGMKCPKMIDLCLQPELLKHQKNGTRMYDGYENKAVYALIWKKLEPYLHEGGNVYFSPSGIIYQMNVEALKDSAGKMANEKYHLYRVSTTKDLCYQNVARKMKTATLYGGLTYDMDSTTMCNESRKYHPDANDYLAYRGCLPDSVSRGAWAELPQTGREVDMIANELKGVSVKTDVIKGISGTEESFKSLSGKNISIIHLATHGFFLKDEEASGKKFFQNIMQGNTGLRAFTNTSMKRSGLIFAGGQKAWLGGAVPGNVEDGILLAEEIPTIDLRGTDLLVLSACDTGLGEVNSEGVSGLQRGFKQAGVKTIVMSLWQVNDNATSLFMSQFYKNLTDGQTKQEAFMNAQKSLRDSHDFSDPKYWAAFIMLDAI
jgi:tetratricopeptide (TPR) repeat protein